MTRPVRRWRWRWAVITLGGLGITLGFLDLRARAHPDRCARCAAAQGAMLRTHATTARSWAHDATELDGCPTLEALLAPTWPADRRDLWGTELVLACRATPLGYDLMIASAGPDREMATADDIVVGQSIELADLNPDEQACR